MQKGTIGVTTENIFPVIKKFLYSDHEIFLRELVSNAVDASQKLRTLAAFSEYKGQVGDLKVSITIDKEAGTLTVSDHGIGMTAEDIDKYINQIAFSGAEEFLNKYKDKANAIIGHFGLGFYSAFMVSKKVEIHSLSYKDGAKAVCWTCDGSPEYEMADCDKTERGTDIILHIDDDSKEFLEELRIETLLKKYCRFLPIPVEFNGKAVNNTEPTWTKKPAELTDEDYIKFYHELYPGQDDPLFWIHLNVDYPFTLTGILYFPKIHSNIEIQKNRIQLYCNQVFVTDSVEGVVPEFMMLMQGVIDSPDIPLNVSRSYLQSDSAVKKISSYITRKVAARLEDLFKADRQDFEQKWNDIKIFIQYGMLTDEKFCDLSMKYVLLENTDGKFFTLDEYKDLISPNQTDMSEDIIYLYATDKTAQYTYINAAKDKGYDVLLMNSQFDSHFIGLLERKIEKSRFVRVDSDVVDNLIRKQEKTGVDLDQLELSILTTAFSSQIPEIEKTNFLVNFEAMGANANPVVVTQNEYMRRMKEMAALQPGMNFYAELPDSLNLVVNTDNPIVKDITLNAKNAVSHKVAPLLEQESDNNRIIGEIRSKAKDGKLDTEDDQKVRDLEAKVEKSRNEQKDIVTEYAKGNAQISQLIDLALLANGLLRGENLSKFIDRSFALLKP